MGIYSHPWIFCAYFSLCYICHLFRFNTCSQYCFHHWCFVPCPDNAPFPFCSPVMEHLGGWGWTGASVNTDEVIHNLDYRQKHTTRKEPPVRHPRPCDDILSSWLETYPSEVPELWAWSFWAVCLMRTESHFRALGFLFMGYESPDGVLINLCQLYEPWALTSYMWTLSWVSKVVQLPSEIPTSARSQVKWNRKGSHCRKAHPKTANSQNI